jgi:hypothetical protein
MIVARVDIAITAIGRAAHGHDGLQFLERRFINFDCSAKLGERRDGGQGGFSGKFANLLKPKVDGLGMLPGRRAGRQRACLKAASPGVMFLDPDGHGNVPAPAIALIAQQAVEHPRAQRSAAEGRGDAENFSARDSRAPGRRPARRRNHRRCRCRTISMAAAGAAAAAIKRKTEIRTGRTSRSISGCLMRAAAAVRHSINLASAF